MRKIKKVECYNELLEIWGGKVLVLMIGGIAAGMALAQDRNNRMCMLAWRLPLLFLLFLECICQIK